LGRKNLIPEFYAIRDGDISGNITGEISTVFQTDRAFYICEASGADIDGEIDIEVSNDGTTWTVLPVSPTATVDVLDPLAIIQVSEITWKFMRPVYRDMSSGVAVGTINVRMTASTQGA
jgi:hypothetical protein